jgi:hypothetical protein
LSTTRTFQIFKTPETFQLFVLTIALLGTVAPLTHAQGALDSSINGSSSNKEIAVDAMLTLPDSTLPDAPIPSIAGEAVSSSNSNTSYAAGDSYFDLAPRERRRYAPRRNMTIFPNERAQPLNNQQKFVMGMKESATFFSVTGWLASAGWGQLTNGSPNYGTDRGAYGMRLGVAAIRNTSENIFGDALLAPLLHEDPRYYVMGNDRNFFRRLLYAGTRVLVTRTDSGKATPNLSLLGGNLAGSALTNAYYPELNQGFKQTATTFGGSIGGSAIGFIVSEFYDDALHLVHIKKGE